jgi:hypothetical protein
MSKGVTYGYSYPSAQQGMPAEPATDRPIETAVQCIGKAAEEGQELTARLIERLTPVLCTVAPEAFDGAKAPGDNEGAAPLTVRLTTIAATVERNNDRLRALLRRMEL